MELQRWEYLDVQHLGGWYANGRELDADDVHHELLGAWGEQGWELVAVAAGREPGSVGRLLFKRPKAAP